MEGLRKALRIWPWLAAITSGLACTACFAPFNLAWLCWIALTPLLAAVWFSGERRKRRWLRDLLLGYVAGLTFFWGVFSWLTTVTPLGWFLLACYMGTYFALWAWFAGRLRPREKAAPAPVPQNRTPTATDHPGAPVSWRTLTQPGAGWRNPRGASAPPNESPLLRSPWLRSTNNLRLAFFLACGWITQEWLRGLVFSGWGWNTLGSALHGNWPIIQIVEYTGVPGLSFLVAFANVISVTTVRRLIAEAQVRVMTMHYDLTLTMAAIVGVMAFGVHALQNPQPSKPLRVALVQANIPREQKFSPEFAGKIFDQFSRLSWLALRRTPRPQLIVWPESSMPGPVLQDSTTYNYVTRFSEEANTDLILGSIDQDRTRAYNAALLVSQAGERIEVYRKVHLVPFGEYIPGRHWIPLLARVVGDQVPDDFAFGTEYTVFRLTKSNLGVAPLICFEDTIGELTRRFVLNGANLLVNVTNDGWFLHSAGSQQHLANAVFRCVETRRPLVRAANTGVTCFVNEFGRITDMLLDKNGSQFIDGVLSGEVSVPLEGANTFYLRHGELFEQCAVGVTLLVLIFLLPRLVRRRELSGDAAV